jgi:MprA protease rhombosortase-interaction domain-containing protein
MHTTTIPPEAVTPADEVPAERPDDIQRFTLAERLLHWNTAFSVLFLLATGAAIWQKADEWEVLGINVISQGHVWVGGLFLVAGVLAFALRRRRQAIPQAGLRFSLGQRLGLQVTRLSLLVMTVSGTVLYLRAWLPMSKPLLGLVRDVHFWSAVPVLAFVLVHLAMVLLVPKNRGLLRGMLTGRVARAVAVRVSPAWVAALEALPSSPAPVTDGDPVAAG